MSKWKKLQVNFWKPEGEGDSIEGTLIEAKPGKFSTDNYKIKRAEDGKVLLVFGSTILNDRMKVIDVGQEVKIEFLGMGQTAGGQDVKLWDVYTKDVVDDKKTKKTESKVKKEKQKTTTSTETKRKFVTKKKESKNEQDIETAECPNCEKEIPIDSNACPECGEEFVEVDDD